MLSLLHIENIAVIETADIVFTDGFNVLTGETGAGKSIIIDAIGAILGARTNREIVRGGAQRAHASGVFINICDEIKDLLAQLSITPDEDGSVILCREITADGKNYAKINSRPVTMSVLREVGGQLINIHGQHDSGKLLSESTHLGYLDSFSHSTALICKYRECLGAYENAARELASLSMNESEKTQRIDMLKYQIGELENAELTSGEDRTLMTRRKILQNAERLSEAVYNANICLYGDDDAPGAIGSIKQAVRLLESVSDASREIETLASRLTEAEYALTDAADEVLRLSDQFEFNEAELDNIENRLDVLARLKKRYGATVDEMLSYLERSRLELDKIEYSEEQVKKLEKTRDKTYLSALNAAKALSECRKQGAKLLCEKILGELRFLDMPKASFEVSLQTPNDEHPNLSRDGIDKCIFLISVNTGEPPKPLSRVASGGELSRIMLALKNIMTAGDNVQTMIFDEVDTGLSGRAAQKVAQKLYEVSVGRQVLCVTHSVQLAAMADCHFFISKAEHEGRMYTEIHRLSYDERAREIARITSGDSVTQTGMDSAAELMESAKKFKSEKV